MSFPPPPPPPPPPFSSTYFGFEPCCGGNILYFKFDGTTVAPSEGINIYEGIGAIGYDPITDSYVPLTNQCYRIFRGYAGDGSGINGSNYGNLQIAPTNTASNYTWDSTTNAETPCGSEAITCPPCTPQCYTIYSCTGQYPPIITSTDLSAYVNGYAQIQVDADFGFFCFYVVEATSCNNSVLVVVDGDIPCSCDCTCYEITGNTKLIYIDCDGNEVSTTVSGYWKGCSLVYPFTSPGPGPNLIINSSGNCVDGQCPAQCYELTDCAGILDPIYTTAQSLVPYAALDQVVQIENYDNCWRVTDVVSCDCAIDVVVLQAYDDCSLCNPDPNYKLTNCDDLNTIIYSSSDLSAYVGQVINVETDCPGCWIIEEYPNPIPSDVPIVVQNAFDDCEACKTIYYKLEDCLNIEADIITSTDLSNYIGQIITLEWCPTICWTVSVSTTSTNSGNLGNISGTFTTCEQCVTSFPCVCSTVRNDNAIHYEYKYVDCYGVTQSVILEPGQTSDRICLVKWLEPEDCTCLIYTFTQGDTTTPAIKYASGELINNKPSWESSPGVTLIYYNGTQWIMNNSMEQPQYYLPPSNDYCPEGTWHPISSIPVTPAITITTAKCNAYFTFYGECINGICPSPVYIKRTVKPGYNTPSCSADKYEKISCKASEALYKNVLYLRYGISNCCPEEDEYWLVKKELIDLAALYDPSYPCLPNNPCGCDCPPSDCLCSDLRTCNS